MRACGGPRLEKLRWLDRYQRVTDRLAEAVSQLLESSTILAVARVFHLGWHTVKTLDKARLSRVLRDPDWSQIHALAMDEFALHKGHRYATVVVDPIRRPVLWVGNGRSRDTAKAFFEQLPAGVAEQIRAVAIDMTTAYALEIRAHCPNAEIVYDLFHVVAKDGREVIDRVPVDQANQLRHDTPARKVIKSSRWLLLRNRQSLDRRQSTHLDELLEANQPLLIAYLIAKSSSDCGSTGIPVTPDRPGTTGWSRPRAAASPPWPTSPASSGPIYTASSRAAGTGSTPASSKASTTPSRSSSAAPTDIAIRSISS